MNQAIFSALKFTIIQISYRLPETQESVYSLSITKRSEAPATLLLLLNTPYSNIRYIYRCEN